MAVTLAAITAFVTLAQAPIVAFVMTVGGAVQTHFTAEAWKNARPADIGDWHVRGSL